LDRTADGGLGTIRRPVPRVTTIQYIDMDWGVNRPNRREATRGGIPFCPQICLHLLIR